MAATAVTLGKAMGVDAGQALDDLVTGLGRGSVEILDNLGITVRANEAYERYAASLGVTAGELTDAGKKHAIFQVAMESAEKKAEELGGVVLNSKDTIEQIKVAVLNAGSSRSARRSA